jgi:ubiquinone/menaquinone biosynthesis C-methylase UbiE
MNILHSRYCRSAHWTREVDQLLSRAAAGVALGDHVLEIGAGRGAMTLLLAARTTRLAVVDLDDAAIAAVRQRAGDRAGAVRGDATSLPFATGVFSAAAVFAMLHHVPEPAQQDAVLREIARTLRPGGVLIGAEAPSSLLLRVFHIGDTFVPLPPATLDARLRAAGFDEVTLETWSRYVSFRARKADYAVAL